MAQPITWRSLAAPHFGSSAALLRSGTDTLNQGITSLSDLAKGIADEQKGIEVSNAIAALDKAKTDDALGSVFDAQAANLSSRGIDISKLLEASQNRHKTLQGDAAFTSDQLSNRLQQEGLGIANETNQGILEHQPVAFELEDKTKLKDIDVKDSNIKANESSITRNSILNSLTRAQAANVGREAAKEDRLRQASEAFFNEARNPANMVVGADGKPEVDQGLLFDAVKTKYGINPVDFVSARGVYDTANRRAETKATESANAEYQKKLDLAAFEQNLKNTAKSRDSAREATRNTLYADDGLFTSTSGQNEELHRGLAAIDNAFALQFKDSSGKSNYIPPQEVNAIAAKNSSGGDLNIKKFNEAIAAYVARASKEK